MNNPQNQASQNDTLATICASVGVVLVESQFIEPAFLTEPTPALCCPSHFDAEQRAELGAMMMDQFFPKTEAA